METRVTEARTEAQAAFSGYPLPTSNTTYTPNQFFDVVLPYSSRGTVRLVAYMLRRTLGWCDEDGRPIEERVTVSHRELAKKANISRGALSEAIREAIENRFITQVLSASPAEKGSAGHSGAFEICWDKSSSRYTADPKQFKGFFAGEGNRTYIPNAFFDYTVQQESLALVRTVGAIVRFTIGFQNEFGFRRKQVRMSYKDLERYTRLSSRHLSLAVKEALKDNHIICLKNGIFDSAAGRQSSAAVYGLRWEGEGIGSKRKAGEGAFLLPERIKKEGGSEPGGSERKVEEWDKKEGGSGSKRKAGERIKKEIDIEIKSTNKTPKQQQQHQAWAGADSAPCAAADAFSVYERLKKEGFDKATAKKLTVTYPALTIENQCNWLSLRGSARNKLGMLRRSIEEDWPKPEPEQQPAAEDVPTLFARHFYAAWAGNTGEPVASPSRDDRKLAEEFIRKVLPDAGTEKALQVARGFGLHVRSATASRAALPKSLRIALREFGDEFTQKLSLSAASRKRSSSQSTPASRHAGMPECSPDIGALEQELRSRSPALHLEFLKSEAEQRAKIEGMPMLHKETVQTMLGEFDRPERQAGRLSAFLEKRDCRARSRDSRLSIQKSRIGRQSCP